MQTIYNYELFDMFDYFIKKLLTARGGQYKVDA